MAGSAWARASPHERGSGTTRRAQRRQTSGRRSDADREKRRPATRATAAMPPALRIAGRRFSSTRQPVAGRSPGLPVLSHPPSHPCGQWRLGRNHTGLPLRGQPRHAQRWIHRAVTAFPFHPSRERCTRRTPAMGIVTRRKPARGRSVIRASQCGRARPMAQPPLASRSCAWSSS